MEVTDDEGEINLLIIIKYMVIVTDTGYLILTTPYYNSLILCETNFRDSQYKTEEATCNYLYTIN